MMEVVILVCENTVVLWSKPKEVNEKSRYFDLLFRLAHSTKMQFALFYIIPFITNFKVSYRLVCNKKEAFLQLIFYP